MEIPRQCNTREESTIIKDDGGDVLWNECPNRKRHKDIDTSWVKKNEEPFTVTRIMLKLMQRAIL